jgi:hypothetical protein
MKNPFAIIITVFLFSALTACFPPRKQTDQQVYIHPLSDTSGLREGAIVYALPRTVFTIVAETERIVEKPGPYAAYASDYLGIEDAIKTEAEKWSLISVKLIAHQETDPSEYYIIESNSLFETNILALKKEGLILDLNSEQFNSDKNQTGSFGDAAGSSKLSDFGSDEYYLLQRDTVYKRVNIDSSFVRVPYIVEKKKKLNSEQLAERAAKRLLEMREGKHLILTGEATVFPQNEAPINEINRLEKEYTELFAGKTFRERRIFTYQVIPDKEKDTKAVPVFYFSASSGPSGNSSSGATPVSIQYVPEAKTKDLNIITAKSGDPGAQTWDKLFYRVPDIVNVRVLKGNDLLLNSRRMIYQFGTIIQLPANYIIGKEDR